MKVTKKEYNDKRAFVLRIFGIVMLVLSALLLIVGPVGAIHEQNHCTEYVTGKVVSVKDEEVWIDYSLPGEGEAWLVKMKVAGWKKGDEVRVFYNPEDLSEKYIEGWKESPWAYVPLCLCGAAMGIGALLLARSAKKNETVNNILDVFDRNE